VVMAMVVMVMVLVAAVRVRFVVGMIAVDNMRRHILMEKP